MIFSKLLLINILQRLETQTLGHYWMDTVVKYIPQVMTLPSNTSPGEMLGILILGRRQGWQESDLRPSRLSSSCLRRRTSSKVQWIPV